MNRRFALLRKRVKPRRLIDSVALVVIILIVFQLLSIGVLFSRMIYDIIEHQTEKRALQAAKQIALIPELKLIVMTMDEFGTLQNLTEDIRLNAEAKTIIITDRNGIQVSNTDKQKIGSLLVDPHESRALRHGRPYLSKSSSEEGEIISGNAPIFNNNFDIIGMVSVGYLVENVRQVTQSYLEKELFYIWVFITLGLMAAILIARGVKKATLGLEPDEIANLFQEREAIIASIREGIIATDELGTITLLNQAAANQLSNSVLGRPVADLFTQVDFATIFDRGDSILNQEISIRGSDIIFSMVPIVHEDQIRGAVATFRRKDEIDLIAKELTQVQTYSDMLRAQTHEYNNRLHAIVGMLQMEAYEEVLDFIAEETTGHRLLVRFLTEAIPDPTLSSFLIGKYMHASELKVDFTIDRESRMLDIPDDLNRNQLVTILGNILNNAFEAALSGPGKPRVNLFLSDFGNDLIFEVADSGPGIPQNMVDSIFEKGVSGKEGTNRGYGLYLVQSTLRSLNGGISIQSSDLGGTLFIIEIPKERGGHENN